ncbi:MAG TPA: M20/M25/M40 family metallo-hydrolase [Nitrospiria bacterium]|nr:M20/M25/M40 family metallo-hydrolase [Nitrospiria bacterium]
MIDIPRMVEHFLQLVRIDSLSRKERKVALALKKDLSALGASVSFDDAGKKVNGNVGNLIAKIPGNRSAPTLLLSAHMDTVVPGEGIKPILDGEIVRSDGTTILGGDDKSGISIIVETLRSLKGENLPHGDIEVIFTVCEEIGLAGAKHLDVSRLKSRYGLVLDCTGTGRLFTHSPSSDRMEFTVHGLEAHAGMCPERGISAIKVAAEALADMRLGRIDDETTANVGTIEGGMATNIVPNKTSVKAEARSHSEEKLQEQTDHMRRCFQEAASRHGVQVDGKYVQAWIDEKIWRDYDRMAVPTDSEIVRLVTKAARDLGLKIETRSTGGGCDANVFNKKGITVVNLATGMHDIHTVKEWVSTGEMASSASILLQTIVLNAQGA